LAEVIRHRWNTPLRHKAVDALATKATGGDVQAFEALAKRGWPDEARGELSLDVGGSALPMKVIFELRPAST
jgi:hypothetical protein